MTKTSVRHTNWGGRRDAAGRPRLLPDEDTISKTVTLPESYHMFATELGDLGQNLTEVLRSLLWAEAERRFPRAAPVEASLAMLRSFALH